MHHVIWAKALIKPRSKPEQPFAKYGVKTVFSEVKLKLT